MLCMCVGRTHDVCGLLRWILFFFSSRRRHTRYWRDWSSDVCSSDPGPGGLIASWRRSCCVVGSETSSIRVAVRPPGGPFRPADTVGSGTLGTEVTNPEV